MGVLLLMGRKTYLRVSNMQQSILEELERYTTWEAFVGVIHGREKQWQELMTQGNHFDVDPEYR